jgi:hypothetical protein
MPTGWQTFPVEFKGGLVTNISPLQQGLNMPGSARQLTNFEPSVEGGYRRILGYSKYSTSFVPPYGEVLVQDSGQTGTTLNVANIFYQPANGSTFTIAGSATVYTITSSTFSSTNKTAALTFSPTLSVSPADRAALTFANDTSLLIEGLIYFQSNAIVYRGSDLWKSSGTTWTKINKPSYGTVLVNGGAQTGSSLIVDGLTGVPQIGDTFSVAGIQRVYTVLAVPTVTAGAATLSISPALASSPADNAALTFLSVDRSLGNKHRHTRHDFTGTNKLVVVDTVNYPFKYDGTTFTEITGSTDILGAEHVAEFKNHIFYGKGNKIIFSAPYTDDDFAPANGSGVITLPHEITGLIVFREQLIIFSRSKIHRLIGDTIADFQLQPITLDIGCVREDTIQEVGGDIVFVGPDGIRLLSATDRVGDFGLAVASRTIQKEATDFLKDNTSFASCVVRSKNQYRIFGFVSAKNSAPGILGTQFADQTAEGMAWAELRGFRAYVADSVYTTLNGEVAIFANEDGFVYLMESGNSFDGSIIEATFFTPFFSFGDPRVRKTFYKLGTYTDPVGSVSGTTTLKLDFDEPNLVQPAGSTITNTASGTGVYGTSTYGSGTFGDRLVALFVNPLVGSGFTASIQYTFKNTDPPFSMDAMTIEFLPNDRQ